MKSSPALPTRRIICGEKENNFAHSNLMLPVFNHVIFLGAGASYTSGYPVGQELRLSMTSKNHFQTKVEKVFGKNSRAIKTLLAYFGNFTESIDLLRHGGFATVDEFGKLASGGYQNHVQNMKKLMRFVLSLHNPEEAFHESDYYPFIQRLFMEDELHRLKPGLTIITFNYDCYLDFLLLEAFRYRQRISDNPQEINDWWSSKLTSGFFKPDNQIDWARQTEGFNYFKLHGSIAYGSEPSFGYNSLFKLAQEDRLKFLTNPVLQRNIPPIVFPWELFDDNNGNFISEDEFVFVKQAKNKRMRIQGQQLFQHFKSMWSNAQHTLQRAHKISFVGLGMNEYMDNGFNYLLNDAGRRFGRDETSAQVVVANLDNKPAQKYLEPSDLDPASPAGRTAHLLGRVARHLHYVRSDRDYDSPRKPITNIPSDPEWIITQRYSFKDFIEKEM
jgi:hypothetical protein